MLALASGAGLVALVGFGLVSVQREDRVRAELDARAAANDLATAMRAVLRSPAVLELTPADTRFVVDAGVVQFDDVGWLAPAAAAPPDADTAERLRRAQVEEFVHRDPAAARREFDTLLARDTSAPDVVVAAAWQAHRAGDAQRVAALLAIADRAFAAAAVRTTANPRFAGAVVAALLLHHGTGTPFPAGGRLVPAIDAAIVAPAFARLDELGSDTAALRTEQRRLAERRALLAAASNAMPRLLDSPGPTMLGERLLLWFPGPTPGAGLGALLPREWLTTLLAGLRTAAAPGLPPLPARGEIGFAIDDDRAAIAADVLPGVHATAARAPDPPWFARPAAVVGAGGLLVAVFAASAFLTLRSVQREAAAMRARADFLTGVTHELKTPVAAIRLVADVLTDDDVPPAKQREYFALLAGESARLAMLIDNVLDVGQMERGERAYDLRPGDLAATVHDAVAVFAPLATRAGLAIDLQQRGTAAPATFDPGAVTQALLAVLENARKYAAHGGRIDVSTAIDGATFVVAIRDHGDGVPPAERERIFARFERGTAHRHGTVPGVGLGLHIARSIVARHGGTLVCTAPTEGRGACFVFTFPLAPPIA